MNDMNGYQGGVNPYDAATLSLFTGYGGIGRGGLYYGNEVLAAGAHADGTGIGNKIDCNSRQFMAGLDRVSDQAEETRRILAFENVNQNITNQEFRNIDRLRDVERLIIDGQKEAAKCCCEAQLAAAKCCCETQKLITAEASATRELINSLELKRVTDANNINATVGAINANANANTAAIVQAIREINNHHHHHNG